MSKKPKQQTSKAEPWQPAQQYLTGEKDGALGVMPEAMRTYGEGRNDPMADRVNNLYLDQVGDRYSKGYGDVTDYGRQAISGAFAPNVSPVTAGDVDLTSARAGQGALDPTQAMGSLLSGRVQNQYLDPQAEAITNRITRNTTENVLPQIRSGAVGAGQYGGSRQGIAEGLASSRLNQDLATGLAPLYGQAFENAQNRMMGTAGALNQQAENVATGNINRDVQKQQFNAQLELQRAAMEQASRERGISALGQGQALEDQNYSNALQTLRDPTRYDWENLGNYANMIYPAAGAGQVNSQQMTKNTAGGAIGGGISGAAAGSMFGPWGAAIGGGLGMLGGIL